MSDRLPRVAVGFAGVAMTLAMVSVIIVARRQTPVPVEAAVGVEFQDREIAMKDLMLLRKPELAVVDHDGVRVIDAELAQRLRLPPGERITSLAGRDIHRDEDLRDALYHAALARANVIYVELMRDEVAALVRWRLDISLDYAAMVALRPVVSKPVFAGPRAPDPADPSAVIVAGITKLSDNHYAITRDAKSALISNVVAVLHDVSYIGVPHTRRMGYDKSLKLYSIKPTSVAAHLGLVDDDELADILVEADSVSLVVVRNKNPLMISITLK